MVGGELGFVGRDTNVQCTYAAVRCKFWWGPPYDTLGRYEYDITWARVRV